MFIRKTLPTYWWPVTVSMPSPSKPGTYAKEKFSVLFETLAREEALQLDKAQREAELKGDTAKMDDFLVRVVKDWKDVLDDDKSQVPFSEETLRSLLELPWFRLGLYTAWNESQQGRAPGN